jgi:Zinc finger, C3HC4 type (RING finger)
VQRYFTVSFDSPTSFSRIYLSVANLLLQSIAEYWNLISSGDSSHPPPQSFSFTNINSNLDMAHRPRSPSRSQDPHRYQTDNRSTLGNNQPAELGDTAEEPNIPDSSTHATLLGHHPRRHSSNRLDLEDTDYNISPMMNRTWERYENAERRRAIYGSMASHAEDERPASSRTEQDGARYGETLENTAFISNETSMQQLQPLQLSTIHSHSEMVRVPAGELAETTIDQQNRPSPRATSEMQIDMSCTVCWEQLVDVLLLPCKHLCLCHWCADIKLPLRSGATTHTKDGAECPICRQRVKYRHQVFLPRDDKAGATNA